MTMRSRTRSWLATAAIAGGMCGVAGSPTALAQDAPQGGHEAPVAAQDLAAETAYLKALYAEKELRDLERAAKEYSAVVESKGAPHDVVGRSLIGLARCLRGLSREPEARAAFERVAKDFGDVKDAAAQAAAALRPAASTGDSLELRIVSYLASDATDQIQPFGDRAVPILERESRADVPARAGQALDVLAALDAPGVRPALERLVTSADFPFPEMLARAVASNREAGEAIELVRRFASANARRAAYEVLLSRSYRLRDDLVAAMLSDPEARRTAARVNATFAPAAQALLVLLASDDPADHGDAVAALRTMNVYPQLVAATVAVLAEAPEAALRDPDVVTLLADRLFVPAMKANGGIGVVWGTAVQRAMAARPATAGHVIAWMTNPSAPPGTWDRTALRSALANAASGTTPDANFAKLLETLGMTTPEDLGFVAANWTSSSDFASTTLQQMRSIRKVDGPLAEALLAPTLRPEVVYATASWIYTSMDRIEVTPDVARPMARLLTHPTARSAAVAALAKFAARRQLDPNLDPVALVNATDGVRQGDGGVNQTLMGVIRSLPASSRARLVPLLTPESPMATALVGVVADVPGDDVDRRLEQVAVAETASDAGGAAITALCTRLREGAAPVLERILRSAPVRSRSGAVQAIVQNAGGALSFQTAERLLLLAFEVAPGSANFPAQMDNGWSSRVASEFPVESRRRLAMAALRSKSEKDRRWGANFEILLRDDVAWDALLVVAEDADPQARSAARQALRAIDSGRREMEEFRSLSELRKVRDRVAGLLASPGVAQRRAGIAAVVAIRSKDWMGELVRLAADDKDESVRTAACDALVALGASPAPAATAPSPERR